MHIAYVSMCVHMYEFWESSNLEGSNYKNTYKDSLHRISYLGAHLMNVIKVIRCSVKYTSRCAII